MAGGNPASTGGRDAWSIVAANPRETFGVAVLVVAALLVPLRLPSLVIFPIPGIVWAAAAVILLSCEGWMFNDRLIGLGAPVTAYFVGGVLIGAIQSDARGVTLFFEEFHKVSGVMFILGTAAGVSWLVYRLLDPPVPPPSGPVVRRR